MLGIAESSIQRILKQNKEDILTAVSPNLLPTESYGCGHYGCVFATNTPGVVVKITTDPTEVRFIKAAMEIGEWPDGIVKYYDIRPLRGGFRGRQAYMIWREEAHRVGRWTYHANYSEKSWLEIGNDNRQYILRTLHQLMLRLNQYKYFANKVREAARVVPLEAAKRHEEWAWRMVSLEDAEREAIPKLRVDQRMAYALRACEIIAEMMANEDKGYLVGRAFQFYMERGIVLADVHSQNIGYVTRPEFGGEMLVITDPGHAVILE